MNEIYIGGFGLNCYVFKVGDYIEDIVFICFVIYVVIELNMFILIFIFIKKCWECECDDESMFN